MPTPTRAHEDAFDEMMDECHEDVRIGSLTYTASQVLKATDPVAYREGLLNYIDSLEEKEALV